MDGKGRRVLGRVELTATVVRALKAAAVGADGPPEALKAVSARPLHMIVNAVWHPLKL